MREGSKRFFPPIHFPFIFFEIYFFQIFESNKSEMIPLSHSMLNFMKKVLTNFSDINQDNFVKEEILLKASSLILTLQKDENIQPELFLSYQEILLNVGEPLKALENSLSALNIFPQSIEINTSHLRLLIKMYACSVMSGKSIFGDKQSCASKLDLFIKQSLQNGIVHASYEMSSLVIDYHVSHQTPHKLLLELMNVKYAPKVHSK